MLSALLLVDCMSCQPVRKVVAVFCDAEGWPCRIWKTLTNLAVQNLNFLNAASDQK